MEHHIDLIIPRGSSELVRTIQSQCQHIPVMGHAEGMLKFRVCEVILDAALLKEIKKIKVVRRQIIFMALMFKLRCIWFDM